MAGSSDLFIEQDVLGKCGDGEVVANGKFTEPACPLIHGKQLVQQILAPASFPASNHTVLEPQTYVLGVAPGVVGGIGVPDNSVDGIFERPCKDLAVRKIVAPVRIDPTASACPHPDIRILGNDMDLVMLAENIADLLL